MRTRNSAAVMKTMGHRKTATHYQHPEFDVVGVALDYDAASETAENEDVAKKGYDTFCVTPENHNLGK